MNSQEYEQSLDYTKNKVNLNYQMARVTIKENLSQFTQTYKKSNSPKSNLPKITNDKILSQQNLNEQHKPEELDIDEGGLGGRVIYNIPNQRYVF